jgi:hypothetical protein
MRKALAFCIVAIVAVVASLAGEGSVSKMVAAQAAGFHVLTVPSGGITCVNMTSNLGADDGAWRVRYTTYMAGFITGANFVTYSDAGRNANVGYEVPSDMLFTAVQRYCEQNPSKNISDAVATVYSQNAAR